MPVRFEDRTIEYIVEDAVYRKHDLKGEKKTADITGKTNPQTWQLWKQGYVVLRDFVPKDIIQMALDSWKRMELDPDMREHLYLESDIIPDSPEDTMFKSNGMWNSPFGVALHHWIWKELKNHIDMDLGETYSYTRKYHRGAYLKAHADRPSCEISGTLCLDYKTDDNTPWSIWVDNSTDWVNKPHSIYEQTQCVPFRKRGKHVKKIDLEVGDMLLYQGPNVAHWREKFLGEYGYHLFVHFVNLNGHLIDMPFINDYKEEILPEEIQNRRDHFSKEYNPWSLDGRPSRYHPIDEETWQRKLFYKAQDMWNDQRVWQHHDKSDFVNNFDRIKRKKK